MPHDALIGALQAAAGTQAVRTDAAATLQGAADLYAMGPPPVAVVRPHTAEAVARVVGVAVAHGYAVIPRGGGLSYTGGYVCGPGNSVLVDVTGLDRIVGISESDMYVVAEAGVTWKQLYDALQSRGLRLPFFGTFSGAGATIGGGLSHGALFFGSARYGSAADIVLALEVAMADGTLMRTGQWSLTEAAKPVYRSFGPDLTGLFLHDGGTFGVKTKASLRLIRTPAATGFASFAFPTFENAARALSEVARAGLAEDAYVLDPVSVAATVERVRGISATIAAVRAVARSAGGGFAALRALAELARGGRSPVPAGAYTLHCVAAGACKAAVAADLAAARKIASDEGGVSIAAGVPRMARADPFPRLDAVLGHDGSRWAALNAKVAHSDGVRLIAAHRQLMARHASAMTGRGVSVTYLLSALGTHAFSFESVFHWQDAWLPAHTANVNPELLRSYREPGADPAARALVATLRAETVRLFGEFGAASNQIGRTYPYVDVLAPAPAATLRALKSLLDPQGCMNPGVLGL